MTAPWRGGADAARRCWSTRCRTWIAASSNVPCCSPAVVATSSSLVTTTNLSRPLDDVAPSPMVCHGQRSLPKLDQRRRLRRRSLWGVYGRLSVSGDEDETSVDRQIRAGRKNGRGYWTYGCVREPPVRWPAGRCGSRVQARTRTSKAWSRRRRSTTASSARCTASRTLRRPSTQPPPCRPDIVSCVNSCWSARKPFSTASSKSASASAWIHTGVGEPNAKPSWIACSTSSREQRTALTLKAANDPIRSWEEADLGQRQALIRLLMPNIRVQAARSIPSFPQRWTPSRMRSLWPEARCTAPMPPSGPPPRPGPQAGSALVAVEGKPHGRSEDPRQSLHRSGFRRQTFGALLRTSSAHLRRRGEPCAFSRKRGEPASST